MGSAAPAITIRSAEGIHEASFSRAQNIHLQKLGNPVPVNSYLDTNRSVIISSPAGSGKTEKLARRYIALLQKGVHVERILAITFTDKAAAEMKQRILRILRSEDQRLFAVLLDKMPLMRVSTIHSFCGTLLRRFSFEADIDPNYTIEDATDSDMTWEEVLYDALMNAGTGSRGHDLFLETISERGFRGLDYLRSTMDSLFQKSPFSLEAQPFPPAGDDTETMEKLKSWHGANEHIDGYDAFLNADSWSRNIELEKLFLTEKKEPRKRAVLLLKNLPDYPDWARKMHTVWKSRMIEQHRKRTVRILEIYRECMHAYTGRKRAHGTLDFSDLEYYAYTMLTGNPEWANILYAFDEKTDHILVDEFQDTNAFQWEIINKLTEEWRSGMGAKREEGVKPTLFLVGDEKQSIYYFRGANVEIFQRARSSLTEWLDNELYYEEVTKNYRSSPAVIDFTNIVFSEIMQTGQRSHPWVTRYSPCTSGRENTGAPGSVELTVLDTESSTAAERKEREAYLLARMIEDHVPSRTVFDKRSQQNRPCRYADVAILLRNRTHLRVYEQALRSRGIPFVALKGIGYYQEREVVFLRALVFFLSDQRDDYSLYLLLKSPLFMMQEGNILRCMTMDGDSLYAKLGQLLQDTAGPLAILKDGIELLQHKPLSLIIEELLLRTRAWKYFHDPQSRANIRKFIAIVEQLEARGKSLFKIRDYLERRMDRSDEPKANVNTEGMDAVKIMTIHAAKGLEFPVVFLPALDDPFFSGTGETLVYEREGRFYFKAEPEPSFRKEDHDFLMHQAREEEEQKRLFYVAVTRAEETLCLVSHWSDKDRNFLSFLKQGIGLDKEDDSIIVRNASQGFAFRSETGTADEQKSSPSLHRGAEAFTPDRATPFPVRKRPKAKRVTDSIASTGRQVTDWTVQGDILHRIFESISKGIIRDSDIHRTVKSLLQTRGIVSPEKDEMSAMIKKEIDRIRSSAVWSDIIEPADNAYTELPFVFSEGETTYTGRIDRVLRQDNSYYVYDYKTSPVNSSEIEQVMQEYSFQLSQYRKAVMHLFDTQEVRSFIVFTHIGEIREGQ